MTQSAEEGGRPSSGASETTSRRSRGRTSTIRLPTTRSAFSWTAWRAATADCRASRRRSCASRSPSSTAAARRRRYWVLGPERMRSSRRSRMAWRYATRTTTMSTSGPRGRHIRATRCDRARMRRMDESLGSRFPGGDDRCVRGSTALLRSAVAKNLWHRGWHHTAACAYAGRRARAGCWASTRGRSGMRSRSRGAVEYVLRDPSRRYRNGQGALGADRREQRCAVRAPRTTGFTGCSTLLEGPYGFGVAVAGGVDVTPLVPERGDFRIMKIGLKPYPVEGMTPAMVQAAIELRPSTTSIPKRSSRSGSRARRGCHQAERGRAQARADEQGDRRPQLYYCVAVALVAGECTSEQFTEPWLKNPASPGS